ncbi:hypothetical protein [Chitinophaga nivalis]|uniref:Unsaturated rhamnogalacturonyl hydrolase n=1 Tax=Chitinophaga nivalis TaxID=2991709 RepID=A0ABT3IHI2_9BACT|nr:hypothetical protein [Chitinophaga nivalis]MCW3466897.1 hypothetical protein [Chitinophaga nivalis]MCW3483412.1 hypothetical protein [Chitinophaga nivalis]
MLPASATAQNKGRVTLDYYYNHEFKKDKTGNTIRWHYTWEEQESGGFSLWGHIFDSLGASRDTLAIAPSAAALAHTSIYIIVDPDTEQESPAPHMMQEEAAAAIYKWVQAGGVLVLLGNDSANAEQRHFNRLSEKFGIHFNPDSYHRVQGRHWEQGAFRIEPHHVIFPHVVQVYIKELATLTIQPPAKAVYEDGGNVIMAVAQVGKGTVFAVGDPWFYNEYTDGKRLPPVYQNYAAAVDLSRWLLDQVPQRHRKKRH